MQKIQRLTTRLSCRFLLTAGLLYLLDQIHWLGRVLYFAVLRGA